MTRWCSTAAAVLVLAALAGCSSDENDDKKQTPSPIELHGGVELVYQIYTNEPRQKQLRKEKRALEEQLKTAEGGKQRKDLQARIDRMGVDIEALNVGDPDDLAERMIEILKRRIDPAGATMAWRPMGKDRFAVRMPAALPDSRAARQAYTDALATLDARNLRPSQISEVVAIADKDQRNKAIAALAGGDMELADDLVLLGKTHDRIKQAQADGDADAHREALVRWRYKLKDFRAKHNLRSAEMQAVLQRYAAARAVKDRRMPAARFRLRTYEKALVKLRQRYPTRGKEIDAVVEQYKKWLDVHRYLDDPADLKRLIAAAGQLEFRAAPALPGMKDEMMPISNEQYDRYRVSLRDEGPEGAAKRNEPLQWFPVHDPPDEYQGVVVAEYAGQSYMLLHTQPRNTMLQQRGRRGWGLKRSYPTTDAMNTPAVGFEFDQRGAKRFATLTQAHVKHFLAVLLDDTVYSCPIIREAISDRGIISGSFSREEVVEMARILEAGSLPARINPVPVSERRIAPTGGKPGKICPTCP